MNDNEINESYEIFDTPAVKRRRLILTIISVAAVVLLALITAILLKTYVFDTFVVDGSSMSPTLDGGSAERYDGETVILNRIAKPDYGDIIVFNVDNRADALVKRVIGKGGDTITITGGYVYLNGTKLSESYAVGSTYAEQETYVVPEGHLFCMGDNREHSSDSRMSSVGFVPLENVVGKCVFVLDNDGGIRISK